MQPIIEAKELAFRARRRVLVRSFSAGFGIESVALLGPNGAGKSTILRMLSGLDRPTSGSVFVKGHSTSQAEGRRLSRTQIGYLPQSGSFVRSFTVHEAIQYSGWLKGLTRAALESRVHVVIEQARVGHLLGRKIGALSGGESKRVQIAQALVHDPAVVLLDEPTAALDPEERAALLDVLTTFRGSTALVLTTHNTSDIPAVCDRVIVVADGAVRFDASVEQFEVQAISGGPLSGSLLDRAYSAITSAPR